MSEPKEVELKLTCDAADQAMLHAWPRLAKAKLREKDQLESVYFDTPDGLLQKSGYVLRVRRTQKGYVQTVKGEGDGLLERSEWEQDVPGAEPDRAAFDATPIAALLEDDPQFEALFSVSVERSTYLIKQGRSLIEVALDQGRVRKPDAARSSDTTFISEIELELKDGSVTDLFALGSEIGALVPVRLGVKSKAERGFDLIGEQADPQACKAEPIVLSDDMTAADAFRAISHGCLRHMRINEDVLLDHRDVDGVHQTRVAIRRLRSAMSMFKELLEDGRFEAITGQLKQLSEPLGRARNLDIFLSETLPAERARNPDDVQLLNLEKHVEEERSEAYAAVILRLRSDEWRRFFLELVAWINAGPWLSDSEGLDQSASAFAASVLDKWLRRVRQRGRDLAALSAEDRHKVRIAAKKLRYGAEFFASLYPGKKATKRRKAFLSALSDLQDSLGALNDMETGQEILDELAHAEAEETRQMADCFTASGAQDKSKKLLKSAEKAHQALTGCEPFWR
ncbi:CYTH and CHAD domain-containing protein [Bosea thiooxidans]